MLVKEITPNFSFALDDADNENGFLPKKLPASMSLSDENSKVKYSSEEETILAVCPFVSKETQP